MQPTIFGPYHMVHTVRNKNLGHGFKQNTKV